jgi:hypothetical protein
LGRETCATRRIDLGGDLVELIRATRGDDDLSALSGKAEGCCAANAASAAGDKDS